jgi:outer membrane lipoprotein-sorting protein
MKRVVFLIVCICVFAGYSLAQEPSQQRGADITADEILGKMADEYLNAKSYQDTGFVQIRSGKPSATKNRILNTFSTFFARPESYRFQWRTDEEADNGWKVIWTTGNFFSTLNVNGERELEMDRGTTIAKSAAVTRGASQTVAALLSGTVRGFRLSSMTQVTLIKKEIFDGENCYVLRGHHPLGFSIDVWISKSDFLIRKIRQMNGDGSFQEEVRQNIKLDVPIPQSIFQFKSAKTAPKNVT